MSNRTIVELNHDYAHEIGERASDFGSAVERCLGSGSRDEWRALDRFGVAFVVMTHHSARARVEVGNTVFDLDDRTTYESPEVGLRKALALIADGKAKDPAATARRALGRNPHTNRPTVLGDEVDPSEATVAAERVEAALQGWDDPQGIRLRMGELTRGEMRLAKVVANAIAAQLRPLLAKLAPAAETFDR